MNFNRGILSYDDNLKRVQIVQVINSELEAKEIKPWVHSSPSSQKILGNIKLWISTEI